MPPDKPLKLKPEGVRTFLELELKHVVNEQKTVVDDKQQKLSMFKFAKMLCVSSSYLNCSRSITLDIYRLSVCFGQSSDEIWTAFTSKTYNPIYENRVCLTYEHARKLIQLLLPSYIAAKFGYGINENSFEQQCELLKLTKGKLGVNLHECSDAQVARKALELFAGRIQTLRCHVDYLMLDKNLEFPALNYLLIDSLKKSDELNYVLRYKVKELEFGQIYDDFTIGDENLTGPKNETIKKLKSSSCQLSYDKFEKLVECLHKSCSSLKYLEIVVNFSHHYEFLANQVVDQILAYFRRMNALKTRFENHLISMLIRFEVEIRMEEDEQYDNAWVKTVCESPEFNGWQVKPHEDAFDDDKFEVTFNDAGCKLEMGFMVTNYDSDYNNSAYHDDFYGIGDYDSGSQNYDSDCNYYGSDPYNESEPENWL